MAVCTFQRTVYKSGGGLARSRVEYITRTGKYQSPADARIQHQGLEAGTGKAREDLVYWRARNLPEWSRDDPIGYFSEAEKREGANRVAYTEWRVSLPRELSHGQNLDLAHDLLDASFGETHPYVWAFHDPHAADGGTQPHVHVLWSARTLDGLERAPDQFFKRWQAKHPERGGARKDPELNHLGAVFAARQMYSDLVNLHLEHYGHTARLDPRSLEDRGFARAPEPKLLPSDSNKLRHHYEVTPAMQAVFDHRYAREPQAEAEQAHAQRYWTHRKQDLGISHDMPLDHQLERISAAREHAVTHARQCIPVPELTQQREHLQQRISGLELYVSQLHSERTLEAMAERSGRMRPVPDQWRTERVLAQGREHGLPRDAEAEKIVAVAQSFERRATPTHALRQALDRLRHGHEEEQGVGRGLHVRLHDKDRDQDRGLSW